MSFSAIPLISCKSCLPTLLTIISLASALPDPFGQRATSLEALVSVSDLTIAKLRPEFLSFNFDTSQLSRLNLTAGDDNYLNVLARALAPAHLRVGGTQGDYELYQVGQFSETTCDNLPPPMTNYRCKELPAEQLTNLVKFVQRNNLSLIFGLNDMYGRPTKTKEEENICSSSACPPLNSSNIQSLLSWVYQMGFDDQLYGLELGNELNKVLGENIGAKTQGDDFKTLATLVTNIWTNPVERPRPRLIGPDTHSYAQKSSSGLEWMHQFAHEARDVLDVFTFHMYCLGEGSKLDASKLNESFLNPDALDSSGSMVRAIQNTLRSKSDFVGELWGGETAAANQGGQSGLTDTFVDSFWYLDQLGQFAANNVTIFQRQVLVEGGYPLIQWDSQSGIYTPLPDYWVSLLFKRLVGSGAQLTTSSSRSLRAYAYTSNEISIGHHHISTNDAKGIVVTLINLDVAPQIAKLNVTFTGDTKMSPNATVWILQAGKPISGAKNPLQSTETLLNGDSLQLGEHGQLPELVGKPIFLGETQKSIELPPTSITFVLLNKQE